MRILSLLAVSLVLVHAAGCASCPGADEKSAKKAGSIVAPDPGHYAEREHDGRIYVLGDPKTEEAFDKSPHLQLSKSFIGAGPAGQTVVFEVRDKVPELTERLIKQFSAKYGVTLK